MSLNSGESLQVGYAVKSKLRDYLKAGITARNGSFYQKWKGFDCLMVDEIDGTETPNGKPLLSIHIVRRIKKRNGGRIKIEVEAELRVIADGDSGAFVDSKNPVASDDQLSDDAEAVLEEGTVALAALGLDGVTVGERRESVREGLHVNSTMLSLNVKLSG